LPEGDHNTEIEKMSDSKSYESQARIATNKYGAYDYRVKELERKAEEARRQERDKSLSAWGKAMRSFFG